MGFAWKSNSQVLNDISFTDLNFVPTQIKGNNEGWMIYSDSTFGFGGSEGRVVV